MASRFTSFSLNAVASLAMAACAFAAEPALPGIVRVFPLGGQAGREVSIEILGDNLANATSVEFDCADLVWRQTTAVAKDRVTGIVSIAPRAPLGPHMLRAMTRDGYSTSAMFNVDQFPSLAEKEPNDQPAQAQPIETSPVEVQGRLDGAADLDLFALRVRAGERKLFDLRSIEQGSSVEVRMILLDESGKRLAFNDDRDDYDDNPLIEHTFDKAGLYYVKLDQYRGPRGFNFGKNCAYILRVSNLPAIRYTSPLGLRLGRSTRLSIFGSGLDSARAVYLTAARRAEYAHMTYPYTMPIHFRPDPPAAEGVGRIAGKIVTRKAGMLEAEFAVPAGAGAGLWRVWVAGTEGIADGPSIEISNREEFQESGVAQADWTHGIVINGAISRPGEKDTFRFPGIAGKPMHFWTLATQLGVPQLDSVLQLRNASGEKLAENDDVVAGQGSLLGNPDSSLYYTPEHDGPLFLTVTDRVARGGPDYQYRLEVASERPSFQLFTTPENFTLSPNGTSTLKVHLVREAGFTGEVSVWLEGLPSGIEPPRGKFRADQLFEPNADGADMIIPEIPFAIHGPASLTPGTYPIRVRGVAAAEEHGPNPRIVEGHATMLLGPLLDLWNFIRRPLPEITLTVVPAAPPLAATAGERTSRD